MAEKETTLREIGEMLAHVVKHMATKDELKEFREETAENFRALRAEVADVRRDVEELKSRADNSAGYSKERRTLAGLRAGIEDEPRRLARRLSLAANPRIT